MTRSGRPRSSTGRRNPFFLRVGAGGKRPVTSWQFPVPGRPLVIGNWYLVTPPQAGNPFLVRVEVLYQLSYSPGQFSLRPSLFGQGRGSTRTCTTRMWTISETGHPFLVRVEVLFAFGCARGSRHHPAIPYSSGLMFHGLCYAACRVCARLWPSLFRQGVVLSNGTYYWRTAAWQPRLSLFHQGQHAMTRLRVWPTGGSRRWHPFFIRGRIQTDAPSLPLEPCRRKFPLYQGQTHDASIEFAKL